MSSLIALLRNSFESRKNLLHAVIVLERIFWEGRYTKMILLKTSIHESHSGNVHVRQLRNEARCYMLFCADF